MSNIIFGIDGYKLDHRRQYPQGTEKVYSNWTPRDSRITGQHEVVFFGFKYFVNRYLQTEFGGFFGMPRHNAIHYYKRRVDGYLGPNEIGTEHIAELWDLGYLPLEFKALPEGTRVPIRVPMLTVENTDIRFAWLVNYIETLMSSVLWMPSTSATMALRFRTLFEDYAVKTGSPLAFVDWQGHDFSFRGMAGPEAAAMSGAGHLLYFTGTDTIPAIEFIEDYYGLPPRHLGFDYLVGGSVAATEHSVMCAGGELTERETFARLLELYPSGIVSVVSDTWDLWKVLTETLPDLKPRIMAREGKLVIRPDSGDPVKIIVGDEQAPEGSPARKGIVELLWETFGGTETETGHKMLDSHIGCIYGDGISYQRASDILAGLSRKGFASANIVFGIGSYTYQMTTRDTYGFAMKATWVQINGEGVDIFKKPVTDDGMKNSAKGRLAVVEQDGMLTLINQATPQQERSSLLIPVWRDGKWLVDYNYEDVRKAARS